MMKPEPGTYQTTFVVEVWEGGKRKTPVVHYRTTFGGPPLDHNDILDFVREVHASGEGKAKALIDVFRRAENFTKFLKEADKEVVLDLVGAQYADSQLNRIQKVVRKLRKYDDTDHDNPYLGKKIVELEGILGIEPR